MRRLEPGTLVRGIEDVRVGRRRVDGTEDDFEGELVTGRNWVEWS